MIKSQWPKKSFGEWKRHDYVSRETWIVTCLNSRDKTPQQLRPDQDCPLCRQEIRHSQWLHEDVVGRAYEVHKEHSTTSKVFTQRQIDAM